MSNCKSDVVLEELKVYFCDQPDLFLSSSPNLTSFGMLHCHQRCNKYILNSIVVCNGDNKLQPLPALMLHYSVNVHRRISVQFSWKVGR